MSDHLERLDTFANHWQAAMDDDLVSEVIAVIDGKSLRKSDLGALVAEVKQLRSARTFLDGQVFVAGWYAHAESCVSLGRDVRESAWRKYREEMVETLAKAVLQQPTPTVAELHARFAHPSYEYATTQGPRKSWDGYDEPPEGDDWERNVDAGRDGWERFDYHEESYWRRLRPDTTCSFPSCGHPEHQAASDLNGGDEQ